MNTKEQQQTTGDQLATLFMERDQLRSDLKFERALLQAAQAGALELRAECDELRAALSELFPLATEDYDETCATRKYRHAIERARKALGQ